MSSSSSCRPTPARSPRSGTSRRRWSACRRRPTASTSARWTRPSTGCSSEGRRVRLLYVVPNFQNPTGLLIGREKRRALLEWAERRDLLIVEDDPYRELYFEDSADGGGRPADQGRRRRRAGGVSEQLLEDARARISASRGSTRRPPLAAKLEMAKQAADLLHRRLRSAHRLRSMPAGRPRSPAADAARALSAASATSWWRRCKKELGSQVTLADAARRVLPVGDAARDRSTATRWCRARCEHGVIYVAGDAFFVDSQPRARARTSCVCRSPRRRRRASRKA